MIEENEPLKAPPGLGDWMREIGRKGGSKMSAKKQAHLERIAKLSRPGRKKNLVKAA